MTKKNYMMCINMQTVICHYKYSTKLARKFCLLSQIIYTPFKTGWNKESHTGHLTFESHNQTKIIIQKRQKIFKKLHMMCIDMYRCKLSLQISNLARKFC